MNPYPYPRDILSSNVSRKQTRFRSFIRFLGAVAAQKPRAVVAGGFMVVGSIHMLLKGRQWFCTRRSSASRTKRDAAPCVDAGTQTDPREQCSISKHDSLPLPDMKSTPETSSNQGTGIYTEISAVTPVISAHPSQFGISKPACIEDVRRNALTKRDTSDNGVASVCHCRKNQREKNRVPEMTQSPHPFCQLSLVMALLALQKVSSCEKHNSCKTYQVKQTVCKQEEERKRVGDKRLFKPGMKLATPTRRPSECSFIENSELNDQAQNELATLEQNEGSKEPCLSLPLDATERLAPSELDTKPFEIQAFDTFKHSNLPRVEDKSVLNGSKLGSVARQPCPERKARSNQASIDTHNGETPVVTRKPQGGRKKFDGSRSEHSEESGRRQRGKPKRRGGRRNNKVPRREYVDLDNPKRVASQHHFRSNV